MVPTLVAQLQSPSDQARMKRLLRAVGVELICIESPEDLAARSADALWVSADQLGGFSSWLKAHPQSALWISSSSVARETVAQIACESQLTHLFGVVGSKVRDVEIGWAGALLAARLRGAATTSSTHLPALVDVLIRPFGLAQRASIEQTSDVARGVALVERLAAEAGAAPRVVAQLGEVAHELLMNAVYDAPVDRSSGAKLYSHDRKAAFALTGEAAATLRVRSDGLFFAIEVTDPFGGLARNHLRSGLARGFSEQGAKVDLTSGGAGLGVARIVQGSAICDFSVIPGRMTRATAAIDLEMNQREFRQCPKSLHFAV